MPLTPEQLAEMAATLQTELRALVPPLEIRADSPKRLDVYCTQPVTVAGKAVDGMYFASVAIQSGYVGFYFFPVYTHPQHFASLPPELRKCLKGKSCFHIKTLDETHLQRIRHLLQQGLAHYQGLGWV